MRMAKGFTIRNEYKLNLTVTAVDLFNHQVYNGISQHSLISSVQITGNTINPIANGAFGNLIGGNFARVIRVGAEFRF